MEWSPRLLKKAIWLQGSAKRTSLQKSMREPHQCPSVGTSILKRSMVQLRPFANGSRRGLRTAVPHWAGGRNRVEIESRAILVELGAHAGTVPEYEVDLLRSGQHGAANGPDGDAFGALALGPADRRALRSRSNRDAKDDFILQNQPGDGLCMTPGWTAMRPSSIGTKLKNVAGVTNTPRPRDPGFAVKR